MPVAVGLSRVGDGQHKGRVGGVWIRWRGRTRLIWERNAWWGLPPKHCKGCACSFSKLVHLPSCTAEGCSLWCPAKAAARYKAEGRVMRRVARKP